VFSRFLKILGGSSLVSLLQSSEIFQSIDISWRYSSERPGEHFGWGSRKKKGIFWFFRLKKIFFVFCFSVAISFFFLSFSPFYFFSYFSPQNKTILLIFAFLYLLPFLNVIWSVTTIVLKKNILFIWQWQKNVFFLQLLFPCVEIIILEYFFKNYFFYEKTPFWVPLIFWFFRVFFWLFWIFNDIKIYFCLVKFLKKIFGVFRIFFDTDKNLFLFLS